jgi:thymidylate kinase
MTGIIVLDGPDCCGKTTLANELIKNHGARYVHATYRFGKTMFAYHTAVMRKALRLSQDHLVIVDRLWPSEIVYGTVFREGFAYGKEAHSDNPWSHGWSMFDAVLRKHAAIYVFCLPQDINMSVERHAKHKDPAHPYPDEGYRLVCQRYLDLHSYLTSTVDRCDILQYRIEQEGKDVSGFADTIVSKLLKWREEQWRPLLKLDYPNILGHVALAKAIFVGDQLNSYNLKLRWPFFYYGNSSLHLHRSLVAAFGPQQAHIMLANANDQGTFDQLPVIVNKYRLPVYALGNEADTKLRNEDIQVTGKFVHPQYSKRFCPSFLEKQLTHNRQVIMSRFTNDYRI